MLGRLLCRLRLHRWRLIACTNAPTTGQVITVYRQCERCGLRGFTQNSRHYEPVDYDWVQGNKDVPVLRENWQQREGG